MLGRSPSVSAKSASNPSPIRALNSSTLVSKIALASLFCSSLSVEKFACNSLKEIGVTDFFDGVGSGYLVRLGSLGDDGQKDVVLTRIPAKNSIRFLYCTRFCSIRSLLSLDGNLAKQCT